MARGRKRKTTKSFGEFKKSRKTKPASASKAGMQKKQGKGTPYTTPDFGGKKSSGGGSSSGGGGKNKGSNVSAGAYDPNLGVPENKKVPVYNIDKTFMNQVASAEATTDLVEKIKKFSKLKKVKDIYKNADSMFDSIDKNPTLTQYQKNQLRDQINYVKQNHGRLGYSLNDLLAAVGTGAYNKIAGRTPIGKEQAEALDKQLVAAGEDPRYVQNVQDIMEKYGRAAVLGPDGTVRAISPTMGQLFGDMGRGAAKMLNAIPSVKFLTGGKGINVNAPDFGFENVAPNMSGYFGAVPGYSGAIDMSKGIGAFRNLDPNSLGYDANLAGASKALQFAPQRDARSSRTPETTTDEGGGSDDGSGTTTASALAYQPYALPVSYNYTGGPEQMYLGGGYTRDGKPVGPFYAANGGIANFKDYGY
tara:strand:- start:236 stop:1489 length:1254 start_codon:yes stop_codon:yes gene_type:complete